MEPGQSVRVDQLQLQNLKSFLVRRRIGLEGKNYKDFSTPWDPETMDVARIMEMIMFHDAAGGRSYTGLLHRYLGGLDLSGHLDLGRAILVGRASAPAALIRRGGQADVAAGHPHWTYWRILIPVQQPRRSL